jgi:MarR family
VLYGLAASPGISAAALARDGLVTPQTVGAVLANLEQRGLIERGPPPLPSQRPRDPAHRRRAGRPRRRRRTRLGDRAAAARRLRRSRVRDATRAPAALLRRPHRPGLATVSRAPWRSDVPPTTLEPCRFCPASFDVRVETLDPCFLPSYAYSSQDRRIGRRGGRHDAESVDCRTYGAPGRDRDRRGLTCGFAERNRGCQN